MEAVLECGGVARDLGVQQGRAWGAAIRAQVAGRGRARLWLKAARPRRPGERFLDRDLWRHFPQLAERQAGLALGACVPGPLVLRALAGEAEQRAASGGAGVAADGARTGGGPLLLKLVDGTAAGALVLRRVRPEAGYRSLEVTLPWLAPAVAGVNEAGLAVAVAGLPGDPNTAGECRAPTFLLAHDCLQRFASAHSAAEWCLGRPADGAASLLIADAKGRVVVVEVRGARRSALEAGEGLAVSHDGEPARSQLEKACGGVGRLDVAGLAAAARDGGASGIAVWLGPQARRVSTARLRDPTEPIRAETV